MRHFLVGALLVLAALLITATTASLLERAALARKDSEPMPTVVESPATLPGKLRPGEVARQVIYVSHPLASGLKD